MNSIIRKAFCHLLILAVILCAARSDLYAGKCRDFTGCDVSKVEKKCCTKASCPEKLQIPAVILANTPVQKKGAIVFNCTDNTLYYSDGTEWIPLETVPSCLDFPLCTVVVSQTPVGEKGSIVFDTTTNSLFFSNGISWIPLANAIPAPTSITVDPNAVANGVTVFNTIQSALDALSLLQFSRAGVTVNIVPGVYPENVAVTEQDSSLESQLRLVGDVRPVVGCGFAHGMPWNQGGAATYPALGGTSLAGTGQSAQLSSAGNTITVGQAGGATLPNFTLAGLVPGDRVFIRDTSGVETVHTLVSFTATSLTMAAPIGAVNGVGAFMVICPNVVIRPAAGVPLFVSATFIGTGLWCDAVGAGERAIRIGDLNGLLRPVHCLATAATNGVALDGGGGVNDQMGGIVLSLDSAGSTYIGTVGVFVQFAGTSWILLNSLAVGRNVVGGNSVQLFGRTQFGANGLRCLGPVIVTQVSNIFLNNSQMDIMSTSTQQSSALFLQNYSAVAWRANINIQEPAAAYGLASPIGILLNNSNLVQRSTNSAQVTFSSTNPATIAAVQADVESTISRLIFGTVSLPNSATSYLLQVQNGSTVQVDAGPTSFTPGTAANGCLVDGASKLLWNSPVGFSGPVGSTGIGFDVRNQSILSLPTVAPDRTFSNFATMFNFDDNASGTLNAFTSTTSAGGTNLVATNMSRVEIGNATFALSGANVGILTANGGFVGKRGGTTLTNSASIPTAPTSCSITTLVPNTCTYSQGTIVVTP